MITSRHQRKQMIADVIADRIHATCYRAWYQMHLKPTTKGTMYTTLNKIK